MGNKFRIKSFFITYFSEFISFCYICVCTRNVNLTMLYTLKGIFFFFLVWSFTRLLGVVFVNSVSHHRNNKKGNFIAYLQFCRRN